VLAVAIASPVVGFSSTASPASADSVRDLRASIDQVAQQWFDAQADLQRLDARIAQNEQRINSLETRTRTLQLEATARAVDLYIGNQNVPVGVFTNGSALDSARRVELIGRANAKTTQTFDDLTDITKELRAKRATLSNERNAKRAAFDSLTRSRRTLDAQLHDARLAAAAQAARTAQPASATRSNGSARPVSGSPAVGAAPAPVSANRGVHPMHDQPFLVCTRNRESRGIYTVVSASGRYFGAYQFLRTTWDVTAIHAGRSSLVGMRPNTASEYDQDDLAWALYQWQGNAPWGGRC
jgi:hypothetical protein